MERRLAAILAADVVGFSALMEQDETGTLSALSSLIDNEIEPSSVASVFDDNASAKSAFDAALLSVN